MQETKKVYVVKEIKITTQDISQETDEEFRDINSIKREWINIPQNEWTETKRKQNT